MGIFTEKEETILLENVIDFPEYVDGQYLRSTASGIVFDTVVATAETDYPRYYIESDVTVLVNDFGQYIIEETNQIEVAGTLEFGSNGGMLIIK